MGNQYQATSEESTPEGAAAAQARREAALPAVAAAGHAAIGAGKSAAQTLHTVEAAGSRAVPGVQNVPFKQPTELEPQGTAEKVGAGLENIGEFIAGDEALKSLSLADRYLKAGKIAKAVENSPRLAKALEIGMNAIRMGGVGMAQASAHGATPEEAVKQGTVAGVTGGALETAAEGVKALAPVVKDIAGAKVPLRGAPGTLAEDVASSKPLQKFDIRTTQPAAKKAIGAVATDVPTRDVSLSEKTTEPAKNFAERAKQVRAEAKPVFTKLDDLTKDQDMKFSDWQKQEQSAVRRGDFEAATKAKAEQEKLIEKYSNEFDPTDLKNARANWRQSVALDKTHAALNTKAIVQPTPINFRTEGVPDPGYIRGKNLSKAVLALSKDGTLETAGLSAQHIQALQDLGALLEKSGTVQEQGGVLGKALKAAKVAAGGPMTAGGGYAASRTLSKMMTDENAALKVVAALRSAVGPSAAAQATRASSQKEKAPNQ